MPRPTSPAASWRTARREFGARAVALLLEIRATVEGTQGVGGCPA